MRSEALDELLAALEAPAPEPTGGSALAWSAAMAASLVVMVANGSPAWPRREAARNAALAARGRLAALAEEDAVAVGRLLATARDADADASAVGPAVLHAAAVPCAIAEEAAAVASLAASAAAEGRRVMAADAEAALLLARAAAAGAAWIVEVNLGSPAAPGGPEASALHDRARAARARAEASSSPTQEP